jgi:hypothetical protein
VTAVRMWTAAWIAAAAVGASAVQARSPADELERRANRQELRQQLQGERERWQGGRSERGGGPHGDARSGHGPPAGYGPPAGFGTPHGQGHPGGHMGRRMTPEERDALREALRPQRP